ARICVGERFVGACAAFACVRLFRRSLAALRRAPFAGRFRRGLRTCFLSCAFRRALTFRRGLFARTCFHVGRRALLALRAAACACSFTLRRGQSFDRFFVVAYALEGLRCARRRRFVEQAVGQRRD